MRKKVKEKQIPRPKRMISARGFLSFVALVFLWLIPIFAVGIQGRDIGFLKNQFNSKNAFGNISRYLSNQYRVACLFTKTVKSWREYHLEGKFEWSPKWIVLDDKEFSRMNVFGYRTRLHRMLGHQGRNINKIRRQRIAEFVQQKYKNMHPDQSQLEAVRFHQIVWEVTFDGVIAKPLGSWVRMPLNEVPVDKRFHMSTHYFDGREPKGRF